MVNPKGPITGVIDTDNKPYSFYLDGYMQYGLVPC